MSTYRQIQEIFKQLSQVRINAEGYFERSKEYTLFINLFWQAMSIIYRANYNDNEFVKYYTCSLLKQSSVKRNDQLNSDPVEKKINQVLETFI